MAKADQLFVLSLPVWFTYRPATAPDPADLQAVCRSLSSGKANSREFIAAFASLAEVRRFIARLPADAAVMPFAVVTSLALAEMLDHLTGFGKKSLGFMESDGARLYSISQVLSVVRKKSN
jgi:hypothetical protein